MEAERAVLLENRELFADEATALRGKVDTAVHAEQLASTQAAELQRLVTQLEGQTEQVARQRDTALSQAEEANAE